MSLSESKCKNENCVSHTLSSHNSNWPCCLLYPKNCSHFLHPLSPHFLMSAPVMAAVSPLFKGCKAMTLVLCHKELSPGPRLLLSFFFHYTSFRTTASRKTQLFAVLQGIISAFAVVLSLFCSFLVW